MQRPPSTDGMLVAFHWAAASALVLSILTGLRIGADDAGATLTSWLGRIALQGSVHWLHYASGIAITAVAVGYAVYLRKAHLASRLLLPAGKARQLLTRPGRPGWRVRNLHIYYALFLLIGLLAVSGTLRYWGWSVAGWIEVAHLAAAYLIIIATLFHVMAQFAFGAAAGARPVTRLKNGGVWLLKMVRPKFTRSREVPR